LPKKGISLRFQGKRRGGNMLPAADRTSARLEEPIPFFKDKAADVAPRRKDF